MPHWKRGLFAVTLATAVATATAAPAPAAASRCATVHSSSVGGFDWRTVPTGRTCASLGHGVSGTAYLAQRRVVVRFGSDASTRQVAMATVHELSHGVEYRTTAAHRARLYRFVGVRNPSGDYYAIDDRAYAGSLERWKRSPRERLAESVVRCTYGVANHAGMSLVPQGQCPAFLREFRASLAAAR